MTPYLVNNQNASIFGEFMDITFDKSGDIQVVEDYDELGQDVRKAIVTVKEDDSYGTYIGRLRGQKNIVILRTLSMLTILESLQALKFAQFISYGKGRVTNEALLKGIEKIDVKVKNNHAYINLSIITNNLTEDISVVI